MNKKAKKNTKIKKNMNITAAVYNKVQNKHTAKKVT